MLVNLNHVLAVTVLLAGCNSTVDSAVDTRALQAQLQNIEQLSTPDVEAYLSHFTPDAVLLPPDVGAIHGKEAASAFYKTAFSGVTSLRLEYSDPFIEVSGDLAIRRYSGSAEILFEDSTAPVVARSKYLDVLKRQPDGSWKIAIHSWGADP